MEQTKKQLCDICGNKTKYIVVKSIYIYNDNIQGGHMKTEITRYCYECGVKSNEPIKGGE